MSSCRQAAAYVSCAAVFLVFCLYVMFRALLLFAPPIYTVDPYVTKSTLLSDALPWFFWSATGFVVTSLVLGFFIGYVTAEKPRQTAIYILGTFPIAFGIEVLQTIVFFILISFVIPPSYPYLGMFTQESELGGFFVGTFLFPSYCFLMTGAGLGLYIGRQIKLSRLTRAVTI
jgi:hypothetical protein